MDSDAFSGVEEWKAICGQKIESKVPCVSPKEGQELKSPAMILLEPFRAAVIVGNRLDSMSDQACYRHGVSCGVVPRIGCGL